MSCGRKSGHRLACRLALALVCAVRMASVADADSASPSPVRDSAPAAGLPASMPAVPVCAIIADKSQGLDRSPVVALLEAKLSENGRVRLVERNEIDKILKEQELQLLFAPEAGGRRSALGALLKADLLVLLRHSEADRDKKHIDLTVCETKAGLRLRVATIVASDKPENAAVQMAVLVDEALGKYRSPIQHIVATPMFVSKDLLHTYDYLKSLYARSADQYLVTQPEIVVVELEEARAIAAELALADKERLVRRQLPFYLMGEYRTSQEGDDLFVSVDLSLHQGEKVLGKRSRAHIPQTEALSFIPAAAWELLRETIGQDGLRIDPATEARQLYDRARVFMRTSNWEEAYRLAEAAILLQPDDPALRWQAISSAVARMQEISFVGDYNTGTDLAPGDPVDEYLARAAVALHYYDAGIEHTERYLGLIDFRQKQPAPLRDAIVRIDRGYGAWHGQKARVETEANVQRQLERSRDRYCQMVFRMLQRKIALGQVRAQDLDAFKDALRINEESETGLRFIEAIQDVPGAADHILDLVDFVARLAADDLRRTGKYRLSSDLAWSLLNPQVTKKIDAIGRMPGAETQKAARILRELADRVPGFLAEQEADALKMSLDEAEDDKKYTLIWSHQSNSQYIMERRVKKGEIPERSILPRPVQPKPPEPPAQVTLVRMDLRFTDKSGRRSREGDRQLSGWLACSDGVDVAWTLYEIFVMRTQGTFRTVYQDQEPVFGGFDRYSQPGHVSMFFDGRYVWAPATAAKDPHLVIVDLESNRARRVGTDDGLPPMSVGLQVIPVATGKACVAAAFGKPGSSAEHYDRTWCGLVELRADGSVGVEILLEATWPADGRRLPLEPAGASEIVFMPRGLIPFAGAPGGAVTSVLLFGYPGPELLIDLKTRKIERSTVARIGRPEPLVSPTLFLDLGIDPGSLTAGRLMPGGSLAASAQLSPSPWTNRQPASRPWATGLQTPGWEPPWLELASPWMQGSVPSWFSLPPVGPVARQHGGSRKPASRPPWVTPRVPPQPWRRGPMGSQPQAPIPIQLAFNGHLAVKNGMIHSWDKRGWWVGHDLWFPMRPLRLARPEDSWRWRRAQLFASNHYGLVVLAETDTRWQETCHVVFTEGELKKVETLLQDDERRYREGQPPAPGDAPAPAWPG